MRTIEVAKLAVSLLAPPRCGICEDPCAAGAPVCRVCATALERARGGTGSLPGFTEARWAAPYDPVARGLVAGLKFHARLGLAGLAAARLADQLPPPSPGTTVIAVPPAPWRRRRRGFDAAALLALGLARALELPRCQPLRRGGGPRQVGRPRAERLAAPPRIWAVEPAPASLIVVDDVLTTGATLIACAAALRRAGARELTAAVFARA